MPIQLNGAFRISAKQDQKTKSLYCFIKTLNTQTRTVLLKTTEGAVETPGMAGEGDRTLAIQTWRPEFLASTYSSECGLRSSR